MREISNRLPKAMESTLEVIFDTELLEQINESEEDYRAGRYTKLRDLII